MEGLLSALGSAFQLMLEHLWGTLLVVSESWTDVSGLPEFPWEILVCAMVLILTVKRWHNLRSVKLLGKRSSAREEVCGKCSEHVGPRAQADGALKLPWVEASPPKLQTLCLSAMNANLSRWLCQDPARFLEDAWNCQASSLSQLTDGKHTLTASEDGGKQPQKKEMSDVNNNVDFPESPEPSDPEIKREKQRVQEKEGLGGGQEPSKAQREPVLEDRVNRLRSIAEHLLTIFSFPEPLGDGGDEGNPEVQPKNEVDSHPSVQESEVDLKGITEDADCGVSLPRPEGEQPATARSPKGDQQTGEGLPGGITGLRIEEASLRCENSQLDTEIQLLKRKLQSLPDLHDSYVTQLYRELFKEEAGCLESKKKFNMCSDLNSVCQIRNLSKKIAGDLSKELERTAAYHRQEVCFYEERAQGSWVAAVGMERELRELTLENTRLRWMLAQAKANSWLSQWGAHAPAAPPAAHRGPEGPGEPPGMGRLPP